MVADIRDSMHGGAERKGYRGPQRDVARHA